MVTITSRPGGVTYAEILAKAKEKVSLRDLGIQSTTMRRAMNGALVIEVPGLQGKQQAGALRANLAEALGDEAKVQNPVAMGELRLRGIDPSTTVDDICREMETLGGCQRHDLKVSPINNMRDGRCLGELPTPSSCTNSRARCGCARLDARKDRVNEKTPSTML